MTDFKPELIPGSNDATARHVGRALALAVAVALSTTSVMAQDRRAAEPVAATSAAAHPLRPMFDAFVAAIEQRFVNPGRLAELDWKKRAEAAWPEIATASSPTDAAPRLNALLATLKTSHTHVFTADEPEYYIIAEVFGQTSALQELWGAPVVMPSIGIFTAKLDGRDHITQILEGSPADKSGLKVGDEIVSVDGAPFAPVKSFRNKMGGTSVVEIRRSRDAAPQKLDVPVVLLNPSTAFEQATRNSARVIEKNGKRIGYIHFWQMRNEDALAQVLASIDETRDRYRNQRQSRAEAMSRQGGPASAERKEKAILDAIIIDNRVKIGGQAEVGRAYVDTLAAPRGGPAQFIGRNPPRSPEPPPARSFAGRSVMLIDQGTRSAAEMFAFNFAYEKLGPLIGTRTAGAVTAANAVTLPGGLIMTIGVTDIKLDGQRLEGAGVAPTIEVARPIPYSAGADPVLDAAVAHLAP